MPKKFDVEAIEDISKEETYIQDLETEVELLRQEVKRLKATLNKPKPLTTSTAVDVNCCEAYKVVLKNFHELLDEVLPF